MADLYASVRYLKGIGEARAKQLAALGIETVYDLIAYFPRTYEDRTRLVPISELQVDEPACFRAMVTSHPQTHHIRKGLDLTKISVTDESARLRLTFFNQKYAADNLEYGKEYYFYGTLTGDYSGYGMTNPVFEDVEKPGVLTRRIMPIYSLTAGLNNNFVARSVAQALALCGDSLPELLPLALRRQYGLCELDRAVETIHFPPTAQAAQEARRRLSRPFDGRTRRDRQRAFASLQ